MGSRLSGLVHGVYDPKRREFLGRDGARWGTAQNCSIRKKNKTIFFVYLAKLGIFYFFFYLGLAGFFCAMLAVFMAVTPRDRPKYAEKASMMQTRSNPFAPGLGFRPQPVSDRNLIFVDQNDEDFNQSIYVKGLNQYLQICMYPSNKKKIQFN